MEPFSQQALGQLGVAPAGSDEVSEGSQDARQSSFE